MSGTGHVSGTVVSDLVNTNLVSFSCIDQRQLYVVGIVNELSISGIVWILYDPCIQRMFQLNNGKNIHCNVSEVNNQVLQKVVQDYGNFHVQPRGLKRHLYQSEK